MNRRCKTRRATLRPGRFGTAIVAAILGLNFALAQEPEGRAEQQQAKPAPLAAFEPLIGVWDFGAEMIEKNPETANLHHFILAWGPMRNSIKILEVVPKGEPDRALLEGFIMRHPSQGRIVFHGANAAQNFLFEGEYRVTGENTFQRLYTVHYPPDYDFQYLDPSLPGLARQFREELELTDDDTLVMRTYMWSDGAWTEFPAGFPPLMMTRADKKAQEAEKSSE